MQEVTIKKDPTIKLEEDIIEFLNPRFIFLPIKEGFKLKVRDEEYVYKNDIVAMDREGHMVHSSISGRVLGVKEMPYYNNKSYPSLVIENDFKENMRVRKSAKKYISTYTKKELLRVLKDTFLFYKGNYLSDKIGELTNELNYITITGTSVKPRSIVKVKIGSLLSEAFINHFNFTEKEVDVYLNGIMSGELVNSLKIVIDTDIEGILVLKKEKEETERCIKCGLCSKNCPVGLNPKYVYDHKGLVKKEYYDTCIKCGLCSYLCPSNIDLKKAMKECDKP